MTEAAPIETDPGAVAPPLPADGAPPAWAHSPPGYVPPGYVPPGYVPPGYVPPGYGYVPPGWVPPPGWAPLPQPAPQGEVVPAEEAVPAPTEGEEPPPQALVSFSQMAGLGDAEAGLALAVVDVNSRSLAVLVFSQGRPKASVMIPARSELPAEKLSRFFTLNDGQTGVKIVVLEGDDPDPDRCVRVGECVISGLPPRPKGQEVEVVYRYDASGLIRIAARDVTTQQSAQVHLQRTTGE